MAADPEPLMQEKAQEEKAPEVTPMPSKDEPDAVDVQPDKAAQASSKVAVEEQGKDESKVMVPKFSETKFAYLILGCLAVSFVVAVVQHSAILEGGNFKMWLDSLSAEHVVPPPKAAKDVVTIQFCQS